MTVKKKTASVQACVRHMIFAWLVAVTMEYVRLPGSLRSLETLNGLTHMGFLRVVLLTICGTIALTLLSPTDHTRLFERRAMAGVFLILVGFSLCASFSWPFLAVCAMMLTWVLVYVRLGWDSSPEPERMEQPSGKRLAWVTAGLAAAFFLFVSVWTVCRVYSFNTPSYDFGIFSQMFYNMKETGLPMTTIERDGLLSHFHVHMSPVYYLMLPIYYLFPVPATLQILQAAVVASAVIPLWKIGKLHGLPDWQRMLLCAVLLLFPAYSGGTGYDIHENCFLTPLILWLFYGIDKRNLWVIAGSAFLTLMVKEDAAVYVAVIALWLTIKSVLHHRKGENKLLMTGVIMLAGALIWFFLVTQFLKKVGDGVMTNRYDNLIYDGSGSLLAVVKAAIMHPIKTLFECVDGDKLRFIALTMGPLLGLPLLTRRYERYILLIPYILVNLMSDYPYQHHIFFQYTFGSTACLLYLTAVNLADFKAKRLRIAALIGAAATCAVCFCAVNVPEAVTYPNQCIRHAEDYQRIRSTLSQIPGDASVAATTFYTTQLSQRENLYDVEYCSKEHLLSCQYIVISESDEEAKALVTELLAEGYNVYARIPKVLTIFKK